MAGPITSTSNERVKWVRALQDRRQRRLERRFVVEGVRLVEEALRARVRPELLLVEPEAMRATMRGADLLKRLRGLPVLEVSPKVLRSVADTVSPQGVIGVVPMPEPAPDGDDGPLLLVLDGLQDPGNVGTILRSAEASGLASVALTPGTVDVYGPKTVRAGMGAHFALRLRPEFDPAAPDWHAGRAVWIADADGETDHWDVDWREPAALVVGGEAQGTRLDRWPGGSRRVRIPIRGNAESLNAAMAASVILFEAARQRAAVDRTDPSRAADRR